jgi:hypothetical protein
MRLRVPDIARWLVIAALAGMAWASAMETIEFDGLLTTFDQGQEFLVLEGEIDCSRFGGPAAVRVTEMSGRAGEADYLVYLPAEWNGDLVVFGHGNIGTVVPAGRFWFPLPLGFDPGRSAMPFVTNRDAAVCHGFAWAASAFSRHGFAIEEAIRDTHLMLPIAGWHLPAEPGRTYVTGLSIGGLAAVALAETYPHRYAGALAMWAPLGGYLLEGERMVHVRFVFDALFPGLIEPWSPQERTLTQPEFMAFAQALQVRVQSDPSVLQRMASVRLPGSEALDPDGVGLPLLVENPLAPSPMERFASVGSSLVWSLASSLMGADDFAARIGGYAVDTRATIYRGNGWTAEELADLNRRVARMAADPWAVRYLMFFYTPGGHLRVPVVGLRPAYDDYASIMHDWSYRQAVARAGAEALYSSWVTERYEEITPQEIAIALRGLVDWANTGNRPAWPATP